ncbi:MAG TPA: hypothetical protein VN848_01720 [Gemmatimonadales bacterium]|nr:hypothetical protein [Gemmatimonadales bacterium]
MIRSTTPCEERLVALLAAAARGPEREGLFALWLVVRAAEGLMTPLPPSPRAHRRRLQALEARLATLVVPGPLQRALVAARQHLEPATPGAGALALAQLVAPAREVLGLQVGEAVGVAARAARIHL